MRRPRLRNRQWIIAVSLAFVLLALATWVIRPSPFSQWLGAGGLTNGTPISIVRGWADGTVAQMVQSG